MLPGLIAVQGVVLFSGVSAFFFSPLNFLPVYLCFWSQKKWEKNHKRNRIGSFRESEWACAHYVMASKIQWKPFWLATQLDPQNDWTGWQNGVNDDVFALTGPILYYSTCLQGRGQAWAWTNTSAARTYGKGILFLKYVNGQTGKKLPMVLIALITRFNLIRGSRKRKKAHYPLVWSGAAGRARVTVWKRFLTFNLPGSV